MLRITTQATAEALTLRLEGRLEGPWVAALTESWLRARARFRKRPIRVDLNGVTFVSALGEARLAEMYAHGAELLGGEIETEALVAEIVGH